MRRCRPLPLYVPLKPLDAVFQEIAFPPLLGFIQMVKSCQIGIFKEKPIHACGDGIGNAIAIDLIPDHGLPVHELVSVGVKHFDPLSADAEMTVADRSRIQGDWGIDTLDCRFQEES